MSFLPEGIAVVGDGRLAPALAHLCAQGGHDVWFYPPDEEQRAELTKNRAVPAVVPELEKIDDRVTVTEDLEALAKSCQLVLYTGSTEDVEELFDRLGAVLDGGHFFVHAAHRLYGERLETTGAMIRRYTPCLQIGALAGPLRVGELLAGSPNAVVIGSHFPELIARVRQILERKYLRMYPRDDLLGVEYAAALVQVVAVVVGLADELDLGAATNATLLTRGLAEAARLGAQLGASAATFSGLAGLGRLVDGARRGSSNYDLGKHMGKGVAGAALLAKARVQGQGVHLIHPIREYAEAHDIRMPISTVLDDICQGRLSPREGIDVLLSTEASNEAE